MSLRQLFQWQQSDTVSSEEQKTSNELTVRNEELANTIDTLQKENSELRKEKDTILKEANERESSSNRKIESIVNLTMKARGLMGSIHGSLAKLRSDQAGNKDLMTMDALEKNADKLLSIIYQAMSELGIEHGSDEDNYRLTGKQASDRHARKRKSRRKQLILIVDDNNDMRYFIKSLLKEDFDVYEAGDGDSGFEMASNLMPDLIISDLLMPGCNGMEYCARIRSDKQLCHIPFLILTGHEKEDTRLKSYESGVDGYLTKPFDAKLLKVRIENILENRKNVQTPPAMNLENEYDKADIEEPDRIFMEKVAQIMKENYSNPDFNVSDLTAKAGMSATSFYKKITAITGHTTSHYIRLYRLQTAMHLIEEHKGTSGINVSDIAYRVGFNDPKYFTRCFVAHYGVQPKTLLGGKLDSRYVKEKGVAYDTQPNNEANAI